MRLDALHIRRLPGIQGTLAVDSFSAGVNVVTGANASGKSSLLRALRLLLTPRRDDPPNVMLEAVFSDDHHRWQVERIGREILWHRDGEPHAPPPLPDADTLGGYLLPVDELLQLSRTDQAVASRLRRELAGGYDLSVLRGDGGVFAVHPRRDRTAGETLQHSEQALRRAEADNRQLLEQRRRLPELDEDIARAGTALRRAQQYRAGLELADACRATREARLYLDRFPDSMPEGITAEEVDNLEKARERESGQAEAAREEADAALARLQATGMEETAPEASAIAAMRTRLDELRDLEARREKACEEQAAAAERMREAGELLGIDVGSRAQLDTAQVARLEEAVQELAQAAADHRQARAVAAAHEANAPAGRPAARRHLAVAFTLIGGGAPAGGGFAGWGPLGWWAVLAAAAAAAGVIGLAWLLRQALRPATATGRDAAAADRLNEADQALAAARERLRARAAEAGLQLDPEHIAQHFQLVLQRVVALDQARAEHAGASARIHHLDDSAGPLRERLVEFLNGWDAAADGRDPAALGRALETLDQQTQTAWQAQREYQQAQEKEARARAAARDADARLRELYQRAGVEPGDRATLLERIRDLPAWEQARDALRTARIQEDTARQRLSDAPEDIRARAEAEDTAWLQEQLNIAAAEADRHEALIHERAGIDHALRDAERQLRLEAARAERDEAAEAVADRYEQRMIAEAGRCLLDEVEQEHRSRHRPEAIRLADERLRRFTHDAFTLELNDAGEPCARETATAAVRPLAELSVGTRMQLLIALRMAWVEQHEQHHVALPLMLDEALTTTDPARFDAVAGALHALTRAEARQLVYLTAQPEDAERWRRATGEAPRVIDLDRLRMPDTPPPEPLPLPARERIPAPEDHDRESYAAALGVPAVDPRAPAGSLHLFHLLGDDLALLHRLLADFHVTTLGQADSLLQGPAGQRHLDQAARRRLVHRIAAARAWFDAVDIGRGTPVDRPALEQGPMSNWQHLDALAERAAEVAGDPRAFVESLRDNRISGVGPKKIEQIAAWLEEQGFVDPRSPLDATERWHHVLARLPDEATAVAEAQWVVAALEQAVGQEASADGNAVMAGW
ncbi:hypothetical protein QWY84_10265 [Aquisalimonas lutea]|uniref:ATP-binding protein n=1 Tax=Aquisalimonas lutea TaxID=1327750 RepID=UPI0025B3C225|nr:hypothetical protein [Aquisalimonas lutea]MDN3517992.1 hypothetical protein [Aquisalimonas lutea]